MGVKVSYTFNGVSIIFRFHNLIDEDMNMLFQFIFLYYLVVRFNVYMF